MVKGWHVIAVGHSLWGSLLAAAPMAHDDIHPRCDSNFINRVGTRHCWFIYFIFKRRSFLIEQNDF